MTFGENLKTLRNSRSLSQKDLAEELGFSFQNISKWERNESLPDIETLLAIARFFGTTTDALLGYAPKEKFSTLLIDENEVKIYRTYPDKEEKNTGKIIFAIDDKNKISAIIFIQYMRAYRTGYIRENYDPLEENSTILYELTYRPRGSRENVVDYKKIKIPKHGLVISMSESVFAVKKILKFIIPEEYWAYLDPDSHSGYYNCRNGKNLFSDILKHNELDYINVEVADSGILFKKPTEMVDPMSVNIETLAKIVRKELQKEHDRQIEELKNKIDEIEDLASDNESNIDDFDGRMNELETNVAEIMSRFKQKENDDEENE